jgi:hypothetical protein
LDVDGGYPIGRDGYPDPNYRFNVSGRDDGGGGGGRGRGSGRAAAVYVKPDEESVKQQVKAYVVAVTGTADRAMIEAATKKLMAADRLRFDRRESEDVDPWLAVQEHVRGTSAYKNLHRLRPESVDEMDWVTQPQARLQQLGLSAKRANQMAQQAAKVGARDPEALQGIAEKTTLRTTGRMHSAQRERLKSTIAGVMRYIK